jgi:hypothetical protein
LNFITTIVGVILIINAGPAHSAGRLSSRTLALKSGARLLVYPIIMLVIGIFLVSRPDQSLGSDHEDLRASC